MLRGRRGSGRGSWPAATRRSAAATRTTMVLQAANFTRLPDPAHVPEARPAHSDGSNRWEKGVDPMIAPIASRAAARLISRQVCGAPHDAAARSTSPADLAPRAQLRGCGMDRVAHITALRVSLGPARSRELPRCPASIRAPDRARSTCACSPHPLRSTSRARSTYSRRSCCIYGLEHAPIAALGSGRRGGLIRLCSACDGTKSPTPASAWGPTEAQTPLRTCRRRHARLLGLGADDPRREDALGAQPVPHLPLASARRCPAEPARGARTQCRLGSRRPRALRDRAHRRSRRRPELLREARTFSAVHARPSGRRRVAPAPASRPRLLPRQGRARVHPRRGRRDLPRRRDPDGDRDPFLHPGGAGSCRCRASPVLGFVRARHPLHGCSFGFDDPVVVMELDLDRLVRAAGEAPAGPSRRSRVPAAAPGHRGRRGRRSTPRAPCWRPYAVPGAELLERRPGLRRPA